MTENFNPNGHAPLTKAEALELFVAKKAPKKNLQAKYHKTEWFKVLSGRVKNHLWTCVMCDGDISLTTHHRHYRTMFRENPLTAVTLLCKRCHGKHHRGSRR